MKLKRSSPAVYRYDDAVRDVRTGAADLPMVVNRFIAQLDDDELLWLLDGDTPVYKTTTLPKQIKSGAVAMGELPRLGFPGIRFSDGPRGVVMGASTAFPVTMARAATWDPGLEEQVGRAMGLEARAGGANYSGAVCVNLLRHPAWGRAQECYGEDPVLTGQMGSGLTRGVRENVMACVKHFALNSMENARFKVDVVVDDHALHEVYLPHFKAVIDAGAESVMSAYNSVNGAFCGENKVLLTDILRDEWGFKGFVTSDWVFGVHDGLQSLEAGLDVEAPLRLQRARELPEALKDGRLPRQLVVTSVRRILSTMIRHAASLTTSQPSAEVVASVEHRTLARQVAAQGMVLLKNDPVEGTPVLPLAATITRIAVIGKLATEANTGDHGSSLVHPPTTSTPLDGLREALPGVQIVHVDGSDTTIAAHIAASSDVAIVVAGMSFDDEGERIENDDADGLKIFGWPLNTRPVEWLLTKLANSQFGRGGDRESLTLHDDDEALIAAVTAANPRTAVVMIGGSAIITEAWRDRAAAIVMAWYPGMEGGRALADVLTGAQEPGGRLPMTIPVDPSHLPFFESSASTIVYDSWWGQRKLDRDGNPAAFPFGFGLGYTTFATELIQHRTVSDGAGTASVRVRNTGDRAGSTVAQVYAADIDLARPVPQLLGFRRIELAAGEERTIEVTLDLTPTRERDPHTRSWGPRPGTWAVVAAQHSPDTLDGAQLLATGAAAPAGHR